jgi:RNA polymerase sigma-70 factor (ECF subfamily)
MSSECDREERSLIEKCLCGDGYAWDKLFELHQPRIAGIVRWPKWKFDRHEIEDVMQEALEEVVKSLKTFKFQSALATFIHKVTVNTCIEQIRKKTAAKRDGLCVPIDPTGTDREDTDAHIPVNPGLNQEEMLLGMERVGLLKQALTSLDKRCKDLVRLRYFEDLSFQEIAFRLDTKQNTLVVQLKRCLLRVLRQFQTEGR